ncbi:MAG: UDP-N-acetylmuramate--L-alanine ligase [Spirochaetaceae bacterium]|jgi:UDP-N-acetylmuramate--alanine ligase|nr:UDP-N-acetylmuramate--L-alanine ligase [Spirochaetaceae bacterium]
MTDITLPEDMKGYRLHFVGIKGTGMTALAEICSSRGAILSGSDVAERFYTDEILEKLNIPPVTPFNAENITGDIALVVYSSAYKPGENPELIAAAQMGIPCMLYSEALGALSAASYSCGIAGVHGTTTTTGLTGTILKELNFPAQVLAGSVITSFDDSCTLNMGHDYFVAETCEYQRNFLHFHPRKILLTSIESDHQDYYPTYESILGAFKEYIELLPDFSEIIYCADDPGCVEAVKFIFTDRPDLVYIGYGEKAMGDFKLTYKGIKNEKQVFTLSGFPGEFRLSVPGRHNVLNAAGAVALSMALVREKNGALTGSDMEKIRTGLLAFRGAKRRSEVIGSAAGILFIDDYGHHPTAIATTLAGLKEFYPGRRLVVDFMSHTYTRTAALLNEFASSFGAADEVVLHKIYGSAREKYNGNVTGKKLYAKTQCKHPNVKYFEEIMDAESYLRGSLKKGDLFVTMGAGDNWKLGQALFSYFQN